MTVLRWLNNNKSCIEIALTEEELASHSQLNNNKSCIEIV